MDEDLSSSFAFIIALTPRALPPPPPAATSNRAPPRGHGHVPGERAAHLEHQRVHGGRGLHPHDPGAPPLRTTREICGGRANRPFSLFSYFPLTARPPRRPPTPIARAGSPRARQARARRQGRHHHLQRRSDDHEGAGRTRPSQPRAPPRTTRRSRARGPPSRERARLISSSRFIGGPVPPGSEPSRDFFFSSLSPRRDEWTVLLSPRK